MKSGSNLLVLVLAGVGIILIYSSIKNVNPKDVVTRAFGKG